MRAPAIEARPPGRRRGFPSWQTLLHAFDDAHVAHRAVAQFLQPRDTKSQKKNTIDAHNDVQVNELGDSRFQCTTRYNGQSIHWQLMAKNREGNKASVAVLGSDW